MQAGDGIHGIQLALEEIPDLIICDIMMLGYDGYQVLELDSLTRVDLGNPVHLSHRKSGS